ncbi:hypothetical protein GDO86_016649 [Hymenochirus boettgeri]|uniref:NACHT domain-containing protein n=1 Tax=Hymenochirus boettgeri TaxID=247094 RepID=A0A8T2K0B1_9PIPI|nr:hypothetical protein GDO86_016649 [Hymenochirus boettgeri]
MYIIESLDELSILRELSFRKLVSVEHYQTIKNKNSSTVYAVSLLEDIQDLGRDAVLGFWESLYVLQSDHPHPNLLAVLDELTQTDKIVFLIVLVVSSAVVFVYFPACQLEHRQHLLEKTQDLVEHKAPGLKTERQNVPLSDRYLDLIVVSNNTFRKRDQHEVIATGGILEQYLHKTQCNLEKISHNRLFRWCHRSRCVPQAVLVCGVPGVGKTTLMQKFVYDWVNGKIYQRFAFVFFFKFRDLKQDEFSLAQMVVNQYPHLHSHLERIFQHPEKLLFIFDGLDESKIPMEFKSNQLCNNTHSTESVCVIVESLARQSLLQGCSVLITSRPTKLSMINLQVFKRISEIMGFSPTEREGYFKNFLKDPESANKTFHYVRENGMLYTFCYIPCYCWIICTVLSKCFNVHTTPTKCQTQFLPKTVTMLFVTFVCNIFENHTHDLSEAKAMLTHLGWMAERGVMDQILTFYEEDLHSFPGSSSSHLLSSFMEESLQSSWKSYSFLHLTIQEFLAAFVHYLDYSHEKLKTSLDRAKVFEDGHGEMFLRFISGLSDTATRSMLEPYVGKLSFQTSRQVISFLQDSICQDVLPNNTDPDKRKMLNVFACLAESRNNLLVKSTLGSNRQLDFSDFFLAPLDCTVLDFILESCEQTECLDLSSCFIQTEGLERLEPTLHTVTDLSEYNRYTMT